MKTMRKEDMDKAAWSWAEFTDLKSISQDHIELAYRLKLNVCKPNSCRRNCRGNPKCLSGLGESKWLGPKAVAAAKEIWGTDLEDPNEERRKEGQFVGLRNLGATCYVNSLLQLWFHNIEFRKAIYSWCPEEDPQEVCNITLNGIDGMEYVPETSIGHLQLLFALLEFGNRRTIDPTAFICSLGLNTALQQDAQEFSKLFISMLEERLSHQSSPIVKNIINDQFCGTYFYVTKCQTCGTESSHPSLFYELELNVAGHSTLSGCLEEFLKEEKLEGDDKYHCDVCMSKQNASRSTKLDRLPPVLNLQLLRFVWQNGCKKKINTFIQFPEILDMSSFVSEPAESLLYMLTAVLIHRGHSAHSGHYIAHIYDNATSTWYKFNDDNVDKMEGKKLKLMAEDVEEGIKKTKPQRVPKGFLSSNSAYMLVYKLQKENVKGENEKSNSVEEKVKAKTTELPERLQKLVLRENENFDTWVQEMLDSRVEAVESSKARQEEMQNLYNLLHVVENGPFEFVVTDWLVKWLSSDKVSPIDNSKVLCQHKRLDPNMVPLTKCISVAAAEVLYTKYGGGPRLCSESCLCWPCVINSCKIMQLKAKLAEDSKKLTNLLKYKLGVSEPAFWVGKNSLKCWRKLVLTEHCKTKEKRDEDNGACDKLRVQSENKCEAEAKESKLSATEMDFQILKVETSTKDSAKIDSVVEELDETMKVMNKPDTMSRLEPSVISCDTSENSNIGDCVIHHSEVVDKSVNKSVMEAEVSSTVGDGATEMKTSESGVKSSGEENSTVGKCIMVSEADSSDGTPCSNSTSQFSHANGSKDVLSDLNEVQSSEISEEELKRTDVLQITSNTNISKHNGSIVNLLDSKPAKTKENGDEDEEEEEEEEESFNEDILCVHGNLCWEENNRRLVSLEAWNILTSYFPGTKSFPQETNPCNRCQVLVTEGKATLNQYRQSAALQKERLSDLYFSKNCRSLCTLSFTSPQELLHLVSKVFVDSWKRFVKCPTRGTPESCIVNANLLCPHGGLLYDPMSAEESGPSGKFVVLTDAEWGILTEFYSVDHDITGRREKDNKEWVLQPAICEDCLHARLRLEEMELLQYEKAKIFVRKVAAADSASGDGTSPGAGGDAQSTEYKDDPEYQGTEAKRPRLSPVELNQTMSTTGSVSSESRVRKSTRHRRVRGEKELVISSKLTLLEFKILIMKHFQVAPYDQHLSVDGRDLLDNNATLGTLRVYPESVVILKADEPCDANLMDDYMKNATPEEGFKGTELLK